MSEFYLFPGCITILHMCSTHDYFISYSSYTANSTETWQGKLSVISPACLLSTSPLWAHSSLIFMTCRMTGSQVCRPCGSTIMLMDNILSSLWRYVQSCSNKNNMLLHYMQVILPSEVLIISITIILFGCIFVALGFLLSPITNLLQQLEQLFSDLLLTKQANSGCYY